MNSPERQPSAGTPTRATTRAIYERRRKTLQALASLLPAADSTNHAKATSREVRFSDAMAVGKAITAVGEALEALGMSRAEIEAVLLAQT